MLTRLPFPRLAATLFQEFDTTHHHAAVYSFAHIVDCEEGHLDCGEKPSKNNKLRKNKTDRTKFCVVKLTNKWDQIGPRKKNSTKVV